VRLLNDPRPWWGMLHGPPFTLAQLVASGTLSAEAAALLRFGLSRGASLFVAAGPQGAGKSTLATALLECLPDDALGYVTTGPRDALSLPRDAGGPLYLLINELSPHMWLYLSGAAAQRAFALLGEGVRMVGTVHATSVAEALEAICWEAQVEPSAVVSPMLIAVVGWRRVVEVGLLTPVTDAAPRVVTLARGQPLEVSADAQHLLADALRHV